MNSKVQIQVPEYRFPDMNINCIITKKILNRYLNTDTSNMISYRKNVLQATKGAFECVRKL